MKTRHVLLGFLAGVLGLLVLILLIYLGLAVFELFFGVLRGEIAAEAAGAQPLGGSAWRFISGSVAGSARNAVQALWDVRFGFLVCGMLGVFATVGYRFGRAVVRKRAWLVSFFALAAAVAIPTITWTFVQREEITLWVLESPELYSWKDLLLTSYATEVSVTLVFALALAYPVWAAWRWWYIRLVGWLAPGGGTAGQSAAPQLSHLAHDSRLVKAVGVLFILCAASLVPLNRYHDRVALHLQHDVAWVDDVNQPEQSFVVQIRPGARKIRVVNIKGMGSVSIYLSPTADYRDAVRSLEDWGFEWRLDQFLYNDIPVEGVPPGQYSLIFVQRAGWGYFEYTLGDGGGPASHVAALAFGLLLSCSLVLGLTLVFLGLVWLEVIDLERG